MPFVPTSRLSGGELENFSVYKSGIFTAPEPSQPEIVRGLRAAKPSVITSTAAFACAGYSAAVSDGKTQMKAIIYSAQGSVEVLECREVEKPSPADHQVLVKVRAASVNPVDLAEIKGIPALFRVIFGMRSPSAQSPGHSGFDLAGDVEAVGSGVSQFRAGDRVFGVCVNDPNASALKVWTHHQGSFAEYACVSESALAVMPLDVTYEQAASAPVAALTALQGLRNQGSLQPGHHVLIHGAAGGVGSFAVQIAKALGAHVTAVTGPENRELVRRLGADRVLDYTRDDFTQLAERYDLIFDCYGSHPLRTCRRVLAVKGIYVAVGGPVRGSGLGILGRIFGMWFYSRIGGPKMVTFLAHPRQRDLYTLARFMATGKITPVIDSRYPLDQLPAALHHLEDGHPRGKVVITIAA